MAEPLKIGALVLAAGSARRMGAPKPAIEVAGRPMIAHVLAAACAAGLEPLVVTGAHAGQVMQAAGDVLHVHAAQHGQGMAESLKAGLRAAPADWGAVLVLLADMPFVAAETLALLAAALAEGAPCVVPCFGGQRGNPCGFHRSLWPRLQVLHGDRGARALLDGLGVRQIDVDDAAVLQDFDRPEDLA